MSDNSGIATCHLAVWETHQPLQPAWKEWLGEAFGLDHDVHAWWAREVRGAAHGAAYVASVICKSTVHQRLTLQVVTARSPREFAMMGLFALDAYCRESGIDRDHFRLRMVVAGWSHALKELRGATDRLHLHRDFEPVADSTDRALMVERA